jgi:5-hydroxyisourate hydrolase
MSNETHGTITSHILDLALGTPASNIEAKLYKKDKTEWHVVGNDISNQDGRMSQFLQNKNLENGLYKIVFESGAYYKQKNMETFYPQIDIIFNISDCTKKYHVPLLLNQYGYSTYKGS